MILIIGFSTIILIGIILIIIGKIQKKKKLVITGVSTILLLIIAILLFLAYEFEKEEERMESLNTGQISENATLPKPDRIIYKNKNNEYVIIDSETREYAKIYSELYNRTTNTIEGIVYSEEEISEMQNRGSFVEFDYNTKSKNFVFLLEEKDVGIIKRFTDSGQVIKTSLENTDELIKELDKLTKNNEKYEFNKDYNYISENKLNEIPDELGFNQVRERIYQKIIQYDKNDYQNTLNQINFKINTEMPTIDFEKQSVVITLSQYEINNVKQNIGNIKYEFGNLLNEYTVNVLIVNKVVNTNCIYYNISNTNSETTSEINQYVQEAANGIITSIAEDRIEIGLSNDVITYVAKINENTEFTDYETNSKIEISNLEVGDSIYVLGETAKEEGDLKVIDANKIEICSKEKMKSEVEKYLKDTYRVDGMGIEYVSVDNSGNGFIIVACNFDNFIYPIKLNVNSQTETFLGMGYHLQANYGYVLYEMCDITLDTKITDVDNIKGLVKTIEYIAD